MEDSAAILHASRAQFPNYETLCDIRVVFGNGETHFRPISHMVATLSASVPSIELHLLPTTQYADKAIAGTL